MPSIAFIRASRRPLSVLEEKFHQLVSGQKKGPLAMLARTALWCAEGPYTAVVTWRNWRFDRDPQSVQQVAATVISVGNLTLGGTGKTPMVKWIARWLREQDLRVTLVSRGYGLDASAAEGAKNDEALELEQALPDVPHLQNRDRVAAAELAREEFESQVILLDDGFQHRRLGRDLDIVLLDATNPFGHGHIFPRGLLREPVAGLQRSQIVCLTRADSIDPAAREAIRRQVARIAPEVAWCEATHQPQSLLSSTGEVAPLTDIRGKRVAAFCGIGNPAAFRRTLETAGAEIVAWQALPDHHRYTAEGVAMLTSEARQSRAELMLCTHKDLVKVGVPKLGDCPLRAVVVEMEFLSGQEEIEQLLKAAVADAPS